MANEVRINVSVDTKQAKQGLKDVGKQLKDGTPEVRKMSNEFGGLSKKMFAFGAASLGAAFSLKAVASSIGNTSKATASLEFIMSRLPDNLQQRFKELQPQMADVAKRFGLLPREVEKAFGIILSEGRNANAGMKELEGALGFVARGEKSVEDAAFLLGRALAGDVSAVEELTGKWTSLNLALEESARTGEEAVTFLDRLGTSLRLVGDGLGELLDGITEFDLSKIKEGSKTLLDGLPGLTGTFDILKKIVTLGGTVDFNIALHLDDIWVAVNNFIEKWVGKVIPFAFKFEVTDLGVWFNRVWDWVNGINTSAIFDWGDGIIPTWMERAWDWTQSNPFTRFSFKEGNLWVWMKRAWNWTQSNPFTRFDFKQGNVWVWMERAWDWFKNGLPINVRFSVPSLPSFLGGGGGGSPTAGTGAPLPQLTGGTGPSPPPGRTIPGGVGGINTFDEGGLFHQGGIVGGAQGSTQRIIAQAGEGVFTEKQMSSLGGGIVVHNHFEGDVTFDNETSLTRLAQKIQETLSTLDRGGQGI